MSRPVIWIVLIRKIFLFYLKKLSADSLIIVVTHDNESAEKYGDGIICISDGKVMNNSICTATNTITEDVKKINNNSYSVKKKDIVRIGHKKSRLQTGKKYIDSRSFAFIHNRFIVGTNAAFNHKRKSVGSRT